MNAPAFDTLAFADEMQAAGVARPVAEALARAMNGIAMRDVATKADLRKAVHSLTVRGFTGLAALGGLLLAAFVLAY